MGHDAEIASRITRRALVCGAVSLPLLAQDVIFRSEVSLVRLIATVKSESGELIGGLQQPEFEVFDSGVRQKVSLFELHTAQPLSVVLLLDISGSTAKELKYEVDSLTRFSRALFGQGNPEDAAAVLTFNYEVIKRTSFTRRPQRIEAALRNLKAEAGTSLYDGIYLAANTLEDRTGRRVIVVITDGGDTTSDINFHKALEAAHGADAVIYSILVMPITNDPGRNIGGENALAQFSSGTGGRVFQPSVGPALNAAFDSILRDLRTQYLLGYYPRNLPYSRERFRPVKVVARGGSLRVQTRSGYYGEASSGGHGAVPDPWSPTPP